MIENVEELINDFLEVAKICRLDVSRDTIDHEFHQAPPNKLTEGKSAVYMFSLSTNWNTESNKSRVSQLFRKIWTITEQVTETKATIYKTKKHII